jgi:hypothetical protein
MIINIGDVLNDRWQVRRIQVGRSMSHQVYVVEDRSFTTMRRYAILKMIRLRDLPHPSDLLPRRKQSLKEEIGLAAQVQLGYLPEALDTFSHKGYEGIVYEQFGIGQMGGHLLRYDTSLNSRGTRPSRSISRIAAILRRCVIAQEVLWGQGYVHMNFTPDHVFLLPDDHIKVIGQSAICPVNDDGIINPEAAARWRFSRGYHERETYWRDPVAYSANAHRARWIQFATMAIELLFGIDLSLYLHQNNLRVINLGSKMPGKDITMIEDLLTRYCSFPIARYPDMKTLIQWLKLWTHSKTEHRNNALNAINTSAVLDNLQGVEAKEIRGDLHQNALDNSMRRFPVKEDNYFNLMIVEEENPMPNQRDPKTWYVDHIGMAVDDLYEDTGGRTWRLGIVHRREGQATNNPTFLCVGDTVPVTVRDFSKGFVQLANWAAIPVKLENNRIVPNALSLGYVKRGKFIAHDMPWALLDYDGKLCALPIVAAENEDYTLAPPEGRFFVGTIKVDEKITGLVPSRPFNASELVNRKMTVQIQSENKQKELYFFNILHEQSGWSVTGAIRKSAIPTNQLLKVGDEIPIVVRFPLCGWDTMDTLPLRGEVFDVRVERRTRDKLVVSFTKTGIGFSGTIILGLLPWGTPEWQWDWGARIKARVQRVNREVHNQRTYVILEPLDKPSTGRTAADYFQRGEVCEGRVLKLFPQHALVGLAKQIEGVNLGIKASLRGYQFGKHQLKVSDQARFIIDRIDKEAERVFVNLLEKL